MIIPDTRRMATTIINASSKPKMPEVEIEEKPEGDDSKEAMHAVAEDILKAIEMKDAMALAMALHDFFEMADSAEEPSDEEDKPEAPIA